MFKSDIALRTFIVIMWLGAITTFLLLPSWLPTKSTEKSINVFSWTELIDGNKIAEFEKRTGITVNIGYYENNEELYAKVKITGGEGYDLLMPTEYMVETLTQEGLLQKIDRSKLDFWSKLDPRLLNLYADPKNEYSIPYLWSIYGIGVNKSFFASNHFRALSFDPSTSSGVNSPSATQDERVVGLAQNSANEPIQLPPHWHILFDTAITTGPRSMLEDPRELALFTAFYLYGTIDGIDEQKMQEITSVLVKQKPYVLMYGDYTSPYVLASGQEAMALMASPYALRILPHNPDLEFLLPEEGTFAMIESLVIPRVSTKQELVYEFINFLFENEVMQYHTSETYFFPARTDIACSGVACAQKYTNFQFLRNVISEELVNKFWLQLKSA